MKRIVLFAVLLAACYPGDQPTPHKSPPVDVDTSAFALYSDSLPESGCAAPPAYWNADARVAHDRLNRMRRWRPGNYGISGNSIPYPASPCATFVPEVANAAANHAKYDAHWATEKDWSGNRHICNVGGHYERPGNNCTHFTGDWPPARQMAAGLGWPYVPNELGGENHKSVMLDGSAVTHFTVALHEWVTSVYHRLPMLDWLSRGAGYGEYSSPKALHTKNFSVNVMDFVRFDPAVNIPGAHDRGLAIWPPPDSQGNARSFDACAENPSPPIPSGCQIGLPISLFNLGFRPNIVKDPNPNSIDIRPDFRLYEWNASTGFIQLKTVILYSSNDGFLLPGEYFVYQPWPLLPNKWYFIQGHGKTEQAPGTWVNSTIEWWFKTGE